MAECEVWEDDGTLTNGILACNNLSACGHKVGPSQPMVCDCCQAKLPTIPFTVTKSKPWEPPPGFKEGQCRCPCHDENVRHFAPCCDQTYVPRAELKLRKATEPKKVSVGEFKKFAMPVIRSKD